MEVALKNEHAPDSNRVRKWRAPIRVWIEHQVGDHELHEELVRLHLEDLARITGHSIAHTQDKARANVILIFGRFENMQRLAREFMGTDAVEALHGSLCLANIRTDKDQVIQRASVIIPVGQARMHGKLVSCVVEELTQILGLVNDSEAVYPSIFNDKTPNDLLTGLDVILLKLLYSPGVMPGMSQLELKPVLAKRLTEMRRDGAINNAWFEARKGGLYSLLGY